MLALMEIAVVSMASNVSLPKRCSLSFPSISNKLCLTSIGKVGSRLYSGKDGKNFVEVCLLTPCANKSPSIILSQSQGFPSRTFTNDFCWSFSVVHKAQLTEDDTPKLCVMLCETLRTSFTNSLLIVNRNLIYPC